MNNLKYLESLSIQDADRYIGSINRSGAQTIDYLVYLLQEIRTLQEKVKALEAGK